uniref:Uncharacterized protein n=1 Tax=Avena sativa TaxID=4498 RepID=A0ACD5VB41_AVESA
MDDGGGASPDCYGGGGGGGGSTRLVCGSCELADYYSPDDFSEDGFLSCRQCDYLHIHTQETAADPGDYFRPSGSIRIIPQPPKPCIPARDPTSQQPPSAFNEFDEPRDFVTEPEALGARVRQRYVQGMQVVLQRQLEALVCGVAGTLWVRWVAASKVFDGMWARKVLIEDEALHRPKLSAGGGEQEEKCEWADEALPQKYDRRRVQFVFLRSLRTTLPLYSTLSICFLASHITREAILPTDIYRWAMEGKLPYVAAFTEVDELIGISLEQHCSLTARQLFRPVRVIGAWQLEAAAVSIARRIGLRIPSVNFYAIAQCYLNELSLPVERILPHACRIYEWAMPAELWLSSNAARVPSRVCVMAILIVALRVQYNINGQGMWEEISEAGKNAGRSDPGVSLPPSMKPDGGASEEFGTRELLCTLADAYDKIDVAHDYSKDLHSYLQYCKDVVFPGIACSKEEKHLMEIFLDMYEGREDENPKVQSKWHWKSYNLSRMCI